MPLARIASAGAGVLWVRRSVFDRIAAELHEGPFDRRLGLSEDHSFFERLGDLEIPAYLAPQVEAEHLQVTAVPTEQAEDDTTYTTMRITTGD